MHKSQIKAVLLWEFRFPPPQSLPDLEMTEKLSPPPAPFSLLRQLMGNIVTGIARFKYGRHLQGRVWDISHMKGVPADCSGSMHIIPVL